MKLKDIFKCEDKSPKFVLLEKHNDEYKIHTITNNLVTLVVKLTELWEKIK